MIFWYQKLMFWYQKKISARRRRMLVKTGVVGVLLGPGGVLDSHSSSVRRRCPDDNSNFFNQISSFWYMYNLGEDLGWYWIWASCLIEYAHNGWSCDLSMFCIPEIIVLVRAFKLGMIKDLICVVIHVMPFHIMPLVCTGNHNIQLASRSKNDTKLSTRFDQHLFNTCQLYWYALVNKDVKVYCSIS